MDTFSHLELIGPAAAVSNVIVLSGVALVAAKANWPYTRVSHREGRVEGVLDILFRSA